MSEKIYISFSWVMLIALCGFDFAEAKISPAFMDRAVDGDGMAQHRVGYYYHTGLSVEKDLSQAEYWYQKAAAQGLAKSEYALARLLTIDKEQGPQDYAAAMPWLIRAAETRSISQGQGFAQSQKSARDTLKWICKSGVASFPESLPQHQDGYCLYRRGCKLYRSNRKFNVKRDYVASRRYLHQALEQDELSAAKYLMYIYDKGLGTDKDPQQAQEMMKIAAELGDGDAIMSLTLQNKEKMSEAEYITNLNHAAADGNKQAHELLGIQHLSNQNIERALMHYFLAGRKNFPVRYSVFSKPPPFKELLEDPQAKTLFDSAKVKAEEFREANTLSKRTSNAINRSHSAISSKHAAIQKKGRVKSIEENAFILVLIALAIMGLRRPFRFAIFVCTEWLRRSIKV